MGPIFPQISLFGLPWDVPPFLIFPLPVPLMSSPPSSPTADLVPLELCRLVRAAAFFEPQAEAIAAAREGEPAGQVLLNAMAAPFDFPTLADSVFAGDSVAVVMQAGLPDGKVLLDSLLRSLIEQGCDPAEIQIVTTLRSARWLGLDPDECESPQNYLLGTHEIPTVVHDPENPDAVAYVAVNREGLPVMLNRHLVDADVVIPIAAPTPLHGSGHSVICSDRAFYPEFSSADTQQRFREQESRESEGEVRLANDHLSAFSTIQVVPGPAGTIAGIYTGERRAAFEKATERLAEAWTVESSQPADLVIATIENEPSSQSWDDVAAAIRIADRLALPTAPLVIWTSVTNEPDAELAELLLAAYEQRSPRLKKGAVERAELAAILADRTVFLKSGLDRGVVEKYGLGFVQEASDLARLIEQSRAGLFLRDAHRCLISAERESR